MGNTLCGHASFGQESCTADQADAKLACKPLNKEQSAGSTGSSTVSLIAASAGCCRDEIEVALSTARAELDASAQHRCFSSEYTLGRIIGHGAYCKVMACTHNATQQEFAVKAVGKTKADLKQREGEVGSQLGPCCTTPVLACRYSS